MIYVCWADVSAVDESGLACKLSEYRREKLRTLKPPAVRRAGIGAELLFQRALRRFRPELPLPLDIRCEENGKPRLADCELFFNLSHSGAYAACALSDAPVGVDIQVIGPYREKLAERFYAPEERLYIGESENRDAAFTEIWCRKESFIKTTGLGLRTRLDSFSVPPGSDRIAYGGEEFFLSSQNLGDCFLSVCVCGNAEKVTIEKTELP